MSELDKVKLRYEKPRWVRMNTKAKRAKAEKQEKIAKEKNKMKTSKIETLKTIVITALVTGIIAFIAGGIYEGSRSNQVKAEAAEIVKSVKVEVQPTSTEQSKQ